MAKKERRKASGKIFFNNVGKRYYVVTESSGLPAADYYNANNNAHGGIIVSRDWDHSGDIKN